MIATFEGDNAVPNGQLSSHYKIVDKLDGVPAIHDSVTYAHGLVNAFPLTANLYQIALGLVNKSVDLAQPILSRTQPIINTADGLAVATFEKAEATFPYAFKTPTQDLVVVKQSRAIYDARIAPWLQHASPVIQDAINRTAEINSALGARASAVAKSSSDISHALLEQLKQLAEQGKDLPAALVDGVGKATGDVRTIVTEKDATLQDKSNKLGAYVLDHVKPVVDEIYNYVLGAKNKAEEQAKKAEDKVDATVNGK